MKARLAVLEFEAEFEFEETPVSIEKPALVWDQADAGRYEDAEVLPWSGPLRRIVEDAPTRPRRARVRRKRFAEPTAGKARTAAGEWLRDFSRHGPLEIRKIATLPCQDKFLTIVTYTRG